MIPVYLLSATDGEVYTIDDSSTTLDLGSAFTATIVSIAFEGPGYWSGFRRFIQTVHVQDTVTLRATPIVDGSEDDSLAQAYTVDATVNGATSETRYAFAAHGSRHQVKVEITQHTSGIELGEWKRHVVPRRTERGGP